MIFPMSLKAKTVSWKSSASPDRLETRGLLADGKVCVPLARKDTAMRPSGRPKAPIAGLQGEVALLAGNTGIELRLRAIRAGLVGEEVGEGAVWPAKSVCKRPRSTGEYPLAGNRATTDSLGLGIRRKVTRSDDWFTADNLLFRRMASSRGVVAMDIEVKLFRIKRIGAVMEAYGIWTSPNWSLGSGRANGSELSNENLNIYLLFRKAYRD